MRRFDGWRIALAMGLAAAPAGMISYAVMAPPAALAQQAEKPAADGTAAKLAPKGLKRAGTVYVLEDEEKVTRAFKNLAEAKKKLAADAKERGKIEKNINRAKSWVSQATFEHRKLNDKIADSPDIGSQNRVIAQMNKITSEINKALEYKEEQEKKLKALGGDAQAQYVDVVLKLHADVEKVEAKYKELADDTEVTSSLAAAKPKGKLGPSPSFASIAQQIKKLRNDVAAEVVTLTRDGNIAWVDVTINGSNSRQMVLDTGASLICIPHDLAKALEIVPPNDAATIRLTLANGDVVEAKHMQLKSVRVGIFEVNDVDAAILPEKLIAAHPLLGMSYLSNFIMKVDGDELHLARIGAGAAKDEKKKPADADDAPTTTGEGEKEKMKNGTAASADEK